MALSCGCDDYLEPGECYWRGPDDFISFREKRRKRCVSCHALIEPGTDCLRFYRFKVPDNEIEERIYGEEKPLAPCYLCEKCGEIWLSLADAGYECVNPKETLDALDEYWDLTGFDPEKYRNENDRGNPNAV